MTLVTYNTATFENSPKQLIKHDLVMTNKNKIFFLLAIH